MIAVMYVLGITSLVYMVVYAVVSTAISYGISYLLGRMNKPRQQTAQESQPTLSTRGSRLTLLLGRRRVAPVVPWVGGRTVKKNSKAQYYKEKGMHAICLGPIDAILEIYDGSKKILTPTIGPLYRATTPAGSQFTVEDVGTFRVYWGENEQPLDPMLYEEMGIGSMWPGVAYVVWDNKAVNPGWIWNDVQYVVERILTTETNLTDSIPHLPRTTRPRRGAIDDSGVNPAHAIWYFLTAPSPYGLGVPAQWLDGGAFEYLGQLCVAEHLPVNILARDGVNGDQVLSELMQEVGFFITQVGEKLVPIVVRPPGNTTLPQITIDAQQQPLPEITRQHGETTPTRSMYRIFDEEMGWKLSDLNVDNDAAARSRGAQQSKEVQLQNVTNRLTGTEIMQRMVRDDSIDGETYSFELMRGARDLWPGQLFVVPNFGTLRVASKKPSFMNSTVSIDAVLENYGIRLHDRYVDGVGDPRTDGIQPVAQDPYVRLFIVPEAILSVGSLSMWVLRVRAHGGIVSAEVMFSATGASYARVNRDEPHVTAGTINRPILIDEATHNGGVLDAALSFTPYNGDTDEIDDLAGNDAEWEEGDQIAVIDDEVFLVQRLAPVEGGFRIDGFRRAVWGTVPANHLQGTPVYIFRISDRITYTRHLVRAGNTLHVKTLPYTSTDEMTLATVADHVIAFPA
jgi:hypothetical protein